MPPAIRPVVLAAATAAFPEARIIEAGSVKEAGETAVARQTDLLVLVEPDESTTAGAIQAVDASGLPRWAVVILGRDLSDLVETVPPAEWNPPLLARAFRSALMQHELLCENIRLRGDLKTVAHRISHDLRTPIGCIYTGSHLLKVLPPEDASSIGALIANIEESSLELSSIIDRVSLVLKASADPSTPVRGGMGARVAAVLKGLAPEIQKTGATIIQPASWPEVTGVPSWLGAIWQNLIGNALKHGGPSPRIQIGWSLEADEYRFTVADSGPGILPAREPTLFPPFEQLHARTTSGLGLSLVQRLVQLQGGRCGYEPRKDGLSVFSFTLPAD